MILFSRKSKKKGQINAANPCHPYMKGIHELFLLLTFLLGQCSAMMAHCLASLKFDGFNYAESIPVDVIKMLPGQYPFQLICSLHNNKSCMCCCFQNLTIAS